jgi:hypothetical protein
MATSVVLSVPTQASGAGPFLGDISAHLQSTVAALAGTSVERFSVQRDALATSKRQLAAGLPGSHAYTLQYAIRVPRNATLRSANAADIDQADVQDMDDALYFARSAADFAGSMLTLSIRGTNTSTAVDDAWRPRVNCSNLQPVSLAQLLCGPAAAAGAQNSSRLLQGSGRNASGIIEVNFISYLSATMVVAGLDPLPAGVAVSMSDPVVDSRLTSATVLTLAADGTAVSSQSVEQGNPAQATPNSAAVGAGVAAGVVVVIGVVVAAALFLRMRSRRPAARQPGATLMANPIIRTRVAGAATAEHPAAAPSLSSHTRDRHPMHQQPNVVSQAPINPEPLQTPSRRRSSHATVAMAPRFVRR